MSPPALRRWLRPALGAAIGLAFLLLLARRVEWATVRELLAEARYLPLAVALLALAAGIGTRIVRWWLMLRAFDPALPAASCVRPFLGSLALNNTVPFRAGDVVRAVGFRRSLRASPARVVGTLLVERLLDLLVLLLIFTVALLGAAHVFPRPFLVAVGLAGTAAVALLALLVAAPGRVARVARWATSRGPVPARWRERLAPHVDQLTESLTVLASPRRALLLLGLSLLAWIAEGGVFASVAWSLDIGAPVLAPWLSLGAATLATLLPSTPGYVGTFDWFAALGFTAYGVGRSPAAAVALLAHLVVWLPVTVAGLVALARQPCLEPDPTPMLEADPA
jgi:glycosyltransferase 2 family protein